MDYDFSGLCADQLFQLEKRLSSLNKAFLKEYKFALNIINDKATNDNRGEIITEVEDVLRDVVGKSQIFYTEALNKVQKLLSKYL